jgi:predicted Zn-dependent protease
MTTKTNSLERESIILNQEQGNTQTNPLTLERIEELRKRVDQLPLTPIPSNEENLLSFLLRKMESLDEWLSGPPMSRQDRVDRNVYEQVARSGIRLL